MKLHDYVGCWQSGQITDQRWRITPRFCTLRQLVWSLLHKKKCSEILHTKNWDYKSLQKSNLIHNLNFYPNSNWLKLKVKFTSNFCTHINLSKWSNQNHNWGRRILSFTFADLVTNLSGNTLTLLLWRFDIWKQIEIQQKNGLFSG